MNESIADVVHMTFYVNLSENFTLQSRIADFSSNYLFKTFGENGIGTHAAIAVSSLSGDSSINNSSKRR